MNLTFFDQQIALLNSLKQKIESGNLTVEELEQYYLAIYQTEIVEAIFRNNQKHYFFIDSDQKHLTFIPELVEKTFWTRRTISYRSEI